MPKHRSPLLTVLVVLALAPVCHAAEGGKRPSGDPGWEAFQARWQAAMKSGDAAAIASLTRLPFLLGGKKLDRAAFERSVPGLFTAPVRRCLARARASTEPGAPGDRVMFCTSYNFYFDSSDGQWRLREFGADTP
ncbi:MAG: hypothetical protein JNL33_04930 [Betaproteobacteria bacterium]|nr:hypothetical protein [Betaproteobacteria bacterium]